MDIAIARSPVDIALSLHRNQPPLCMHELAPTATCILPAAHTARSGCLPSSSANYSGSHRFLYEIL